MRRLVLVVLILLSGCRGHDARWHKNEGPKAGLPGDRGEKRSLRRRSHVDGMLPLAFAGNPLPAREIASVGGKDYNDPITTPSEGATRLSVEVHARDEASVYDVLLSHGSGRFGNGRLRQCSRADSEEPLFEVQDGWALFWGQRPRGRMQLVSAISSASAFIMQHINYAEERVLNVRVRDDRSDHALPLYCDLDCPWETFPERPSETVPPGQYVTVFRDDRGNCRIMPPRPINENEDVLAFFHRCQKVANWFGVTLENP